MSQGIYLNDVTSDEELASLITARETFVLTGVALDRFSSTTEKLEKLIEAQGLRCRIYTKGRVAALAAETLIGGLGIWVGIGILAHRLATVNPDYEIAKNYVMGTLSVTYMRVRIK